MPQSIHCDFERRLGKTQLAIIKRHRKGYMFAYRAELNIHFADSQPNQAWWTIERVLNG